MWWRFNAAHTPRPQKPAPTTQNCTHRESRCFSTAPALEQTLHVAKPLVGVQRTLGTPGGSGGCSFKYAVYVTGSLNVEHRHHRNNTNTAAAIPAQPSQDRPKNHVVTAVNILAQRVVVDLRGCAGCFADVAESEEAVSKERHNRGHNACTCTGHRSPCLSLFLSIDVKPS